MNTSAMQVVYDQFKPMNELAKTIHEIAVKHGFYDNKRETGTRS